MSTDSYFTPFQLQYDAICEQFDRTLGERCDSFELSKAEVARTSKLLQQHQAQLTTLQSTLAAQESALSAHESQLASLIQDILAISHKICAQNKELQQLRHKLKGTSTEWADSEISVAQLTAEEYKQQINTFVQDMGTAQQQVSLLETQKKHLEIQQTACNAQISTTKATITNLSKDIDQALARTTQIEHDFLRRMNEFHKWCIIQVEPDADGDINRNDSETIFESTRFQQLEQQVQILTEKAETTTEPGPLHDELLTQLATLNSKLIKADETLCELGETFTVSQGEIATLRSKTDPLPSLIASIETKLITKLTQDVTQLETGQDERHDDLKKKFEQQVSEQTTAVNSLQSQFNGLQTDLLSKIDDLNTKLPVLYSTKTDLSASVEELQTVSKQNALQTALLNDKIVTMAEKFVERKCIDELSTTLLKYDAPFAQLTTRLAQQSDSLSQLSTAMQASREISESAVNDVAQIVEKQSQLESLTAQLTADLLDLKAQNAGYGVRLTKMQQSIDEMAQNSNQPITALHDSPTRSEVALLTQKIDDLPVVTQILIQDAVEQKDHEIATLRAEMNELRDFIKAKNNAESSALSAQASIIDKKDEEIKSLHNKIDEMFASLVHFEQIIHVLQIKTGY